MSGLGLDGDFAAGAIGFVGNCFAHCGGIVGESGVERNLGASDCEGGVNGGVIAQFATSYIQARDYYKLTYLGGSPLGVVRMVDHFPLPRGKG